MSRPGFEIDGISPSTVLDFVNASPIAKVRAVGNALTTPTIVIRPGSDALNQNVQAMVDSMANTAQNYPGAKFIFVPGNEENHPRGDGSTLTPNLQSLIDTVNILKSMFHGSKSCIPGLSPNYDFAMWYNAYQPLIQYFDYIGSHVYWQQGSELDPGWGRIWRRWLDHGKPILVLEMNEVNPVWLDDALHRIIPNLIEMRQSGQVEQAIIFAAHTQDLVWQKFYPSEYAYREFAKLPLFHEHDEEQPVMAIDGGQLYNAFDVVRKSSLQLTKAAADVNFQIRIPEQEYSGFPPNTWQPVIAIICTEGVLFCIKDVWDRVYAIRTPAEASAPTELVMDANGFWSFP